MSDFWAEYEEDLKMELMNMATVDLESKIRALETDMDELDSIAHRLGQLMLTNHREIHNIYTILQAAERAVVTERMSKYNDLLTLVSEMERREKNDRY